MSTEAKSEKQQLIRATAENLRQEGREEGREKAREEIASKMLQKRMDPEMIEDVTELSRIRIQELQRDSIDNFEEL